MKDFSIVKPEKRVGVAAMLNEAVRATVKNSSLETFEKVNAADKKAHEEAGIPRGETIEFSFLAMVVMSAIDRMAQISGGEVVMALIPDWLRTIGEHLQEEQDAEKAARASGPAN